MTPAEAAAILRQLKEWRRDADTDPPATPAFVKAIDTAIEMVERTHELEIALREFAWSNDSESQADCARAVLEKSK